MSRASMSRRGSNPSLSVGMTLIELLMAVAMMGIVALAVVSFVYFGVVSVQPVSGQLPQANDVMGAAGIFGQDVSRANSVGIGTNSGSCVSSLPAGATVVLQLTYQPSWAANTTSPTATPFPVALLYSYGAPSGPAVPYYSLFRTDCLTGATETVVQYLSKSQAPNVVLTTPSSAVSPTPTPSSSYSISNSGGVALTIYLTSSAGVGATPYTLQGSWMLSQ